MTAWSSRRASSRSCDGSSRSTSRPGSRSGRRRSSSGRAGLDVSSSTVRSELYELEAIGLLTHPHTSAGRVPTQSGYRVYTEELVGADRGAARRRSRSTSPRCATRSRRRCGARPRRSPRPRTCSRSSSAPALEAAAVRHVEVLQLQPRVVIVVVITASGAVSKRVFELDDGVDPGLVDWARAYLDETIVGKRASASVVRRAFEDPALSLRERRFLETLRPVFADVVASATELYVGGAAGLLGDATGAELEACQRLLEVLERRAAVLGLLHDALDPRRPVVRVGPGARGRGARQAPRTSARPTASRTARSARSVCSARCGWTTRRRSARFAPPPSSSPGSPRTCTGRPDGDDGAGLLRAARRRAATRATPRSRRAFRRLARELHPDVSEEPDAERAVPRRRGGVRGAVRPGAPSGRTTASATPACRGGGFAPMDADFGSLSDVFAAFFGETLFGQAAECGPAADARAGRRGAGRDRPRRRRSRDPARRRRCASRGAARRCDGSGAAPGTSPITCPGCGGAGVVQQVSRTVLGQIVRSGTCPRCDGAGRIVETPCERCEGDGRTLEDVPLELDVPAGIHDGQRIRVRGAGHAGSARRAAGRRLRHRPRASPRGGRARRRRSPRPRVRDDDRGCARNDRHRADTGRRRSRSSSRRALNRARCTRFGGAGCRRSRRAAGATSSSPSTSAFRRSHRRAARRRCSGSRASSGTKPTATSDGFLGRLKSAFR